MPLAQLTALSDEDKAATADDIAEALVSCLHHRKLRVYTRSRWLGQEAAICDVTLLETVHGLFGPAYKRWSRQRRGGADAEQVGAGHGGGAAAADEADGGALVPLPDGGAPPHEAAAAAPQGSDEGGFQGSEYARKMA
eukprot:4251387-Pyramimonas_sp.AAC.1